MTSRKKTPPPIVLLENVCNAPWDVIAKRFEKLGYASHYARFRHEEVHVRTDVFLPCPLTCVLFILVRHDVRPHFSNTTAHERKPPHNKIKYTHRKLKSPPHSIFLFNSLELHPSTMTRPKAVLFDIFNYPSSAALYRR